MTIPAATTAVHYSATGGDPKEARAELYALQQAHEQIRSFAGGEMGGLTATDAGTLAVDSVDAGTIYVAAQAGSPSPVVSSLGTPTRGAPWKLLVFEGGITLTHGAGTLELPGGANILTEDGDSAVVVYDTVGSPAFWRVISYQRAADAPGGLGWAHIQTQVAAADTAVDFALPAGYRTYRLTLDVTCSAVSDVLLRVSNDGGSSFVSSASSYTSGTISPASTTALVTTFNNSTTHIRLVTTPFTDEAVGCVAMIYGARESGLRTSTSASAAGVRSGIARGPDFNSGQRGTAEVNDAIRVFMASGNLTGNITLEGLKIT